MFAVDVYVPNGRSTVAVLGVRRKVVMKPFEVALTSEGFASLAEKLNGLDGETRIVMEHTGRYYESFVMSTYRAEFFVSVVNPLAIKDYREDVSFCKVKTDKADALKIAQFAIDKWEILPQYTPMDTIRYNLKTLHCQFQLSSKTKTALNNNLIALLEQSYPARIGTSTALCARTAARSGWTSWTPSGMWTMLPRAARALLLSATGSGASATVTTSPSGRLLRFTLKPDRSSRWCPRLTLASCW